MRSLFSTKPSEAGFRLQYMEIFNWGTFDKEIYRIHPQGNNSLLTGANGSGKTTLIDALLTLLVPMKKDRFYNQSSGVEKKGDRNEASYMLGYYGNIQEEGKRSSTTQKLRGKKDYSILLANFVNKAQKTITIFQVRWYGNNELRRVFGIGHTPMTIQKDFYPFDAKGMWKKILAKKYNTNQSKKRVEFCTGPTQYAERMVSLFGMKSIKALSLFNQVVGIKLLGDLDEFIRLNMLEKRAVNKEYKQLKASFITLMSAKNDIEKTKEQIKQLTPIVAIAQNLEATKKTLEKLENERDVAVYWFAQKGNAVSEKQQQLLEAKLTLCKEGVRKLEGKKTDLEREERRISIAIEQDEIGRQIENLKKGIEGLEEQRVKKKNKSDKYNESASAFGLTSNPAPELFEQNKKTSKAKEKECEKKDEKLREDERIAKNKAVELEEDIDNCIETLQTLRKNKNNISGRSAAIREEILTITKATREEIPFIGELIKVNDTEKEWEAAIEKVLHNFALQLIVPEQYYRAVNKYVNNTNLKGLIVYQRFKGHTSLNEMRYDGNYNKSQLFRKISFKPDNPYTDWIGEKIRKQFNFVCSNDLSEFHLEEKAITKEGLIKFGKGKHRKDDRRDKKGKGNYVLGWDNEDKIQWWRKELKRLQKKQTENAEELINLKKDITSNNELQKQYSLFVSLFTSYEEINWRELAAQIAAKKAQKSALEESNDKLKELQEQLEKTKDKIQKNGQKLKRANKQQNNLERDLEDIGGKIKQYGSILNQISAPDAPKSSLENYAYLTSINYDNFKNLQKRFQQENQAAIKKEEKEIFKLEKEAASKIRSFKYPTEKIDQQYKGWRSDVSNLSDSVEFIHAYQKMHDNLVEEGLVRFEKKFNDYLEDTLTDKVGGFNMFFENGKVTSRKTSVP